MPHMLGRANRNGPLGSHAAAACGQHKPPWLQSPTMMARPCCLVPLDCSEQTNPSNVVLRVLVCQSWFPARRLPCGLGAFFAGGLLPGRAPVLAAVPPVPALPIAEDTVRIAFMCSTRCATASSARTRSTWVIRMSHAA